MTDQWVPAPPVVPPPPSDPLPPANSWNPTPPCTSGDNPSIVDGVVITGVPATISAPYAWSITLNDGNSPANFSLNRNDSSNNLIDQPIQASGANGYVTFPNAIFVNGMQADGNLFINGVMQFSALENLQLPGGTAGQVLTASGTAGFLGWASPAIAADAPSNGNLYGRSNGAWQSGGVINGVLYVQGANSFALVAPAGNPTSIFGGKGQAPAANWRWQMQLGNSDAETGGNSGSNFSLSAISDGGSVLSTPFAINRATGAATLQGPTQILGPLGNTPSLGVVKGPSSGVAMIAGQAPNGPPRWQMYLADFSAELGGNAGSNFTLQNCSDAGAVLGTPLTIVRATGAATFGYGVTVTGALVGGNAQFTGQLVLNSGPSQFQLAGGVAGQFLATNGLGVLTWQDPPGAPGGAVPEAPQDGTSYARNDAAWAHLTHTDITDWAATLAPYALLTNVPPASTSPPIMDGAASPGSAGNFSRGDHIHPSDTSRMPVSGGIFTGGVQFNVGGIFPAAAQLVVGGGTNGQALITNGSSVLSWAGPYYAASNPSGYQTAAQVAAVLPVASSTTPLMDGTAAVGNGTTWARNNHVHPSDTSRLPLAGGTLIGPLVGTSGNFPGGVTANAYTANQGAITIIQGSATNPSIFMTDNTQNRAAFYFNVSLGETTMTDMYSGAFLALDPSGNFTYSGAGTAFKPGGGTWTAPSDARIKTVQGDYALGLAEVVALRPVEFTYKGNDTPTATLSKVGPDGSTTMESGGVAPYSASMHYQVAKDAKTFVGLIAQEVEAILPGMVTSRPGFIDGEPVADLRDLDTTPLIFALVNAVKTLAARVDQLEDSSG